MKKAHLHLITFLLLTFTPLSVIAPKVVAQSSPSPQKTTTTNQSTPSPSPSTSPSQPPEQTKKPFELQSQHLLIAALGLGGVGILIGLINFLGLSRQKKTLERKINQQKETIDRLKTDINQNQNEIRMLNGQKLTIEQKYGEMSKQIQGLSEQIRSLESIIRQQSLATAQTYSPQPIATVEAVLLTPKKRMIDEVIDRFNSRDSFYFRDSHFQPLVLSKASRDGQIGLDAKRIIQLETVGDLSQASYLKVDLDGENWLIPNAASPYVGQILNRLEENQEIFMVFPGSGELQLKKPAKLKNTGSGLWEIAERGEFQR